MINIVIPMAGHGSRFKKKGYKLDKPFIDVSGKPMIFRVLNNLKCDNCRFILVCREEFKVLYKDYLEYLRENFKAEIIFIESVTQGSLCTVLAAENYINNKSSLLVANSDQLVDININHFVKDCTSRKLDGSIMTFEDDELNPKWSFARVNRNGLVEEVKEKQVISKLATVGIYFFSRGDFFTKCAKEMIDNDERTNNEFYTCPVYNYAIKYGKKVGVFNINKKQMHGIGTPEDLNKYLEIFEEA